MRTSKRKTVMRILAGMALALAFVGVSVAGTPGKKIATVTIPPTPAQYDTAPQPLAASQCAQCHTGQFQGLKENGGRHRFDCQSCHNLLHAYSPRKGNYDAIMPKCSSCHETPHGPKITDCSVCHANPHTPKKIATTPQLANFCFDCHSAIRQQLVTYPSKHTKVACMTCHTVHGFKPSCFTCHKPHTPDQAASTCTTCHTVHQPLQIFFQSDVPSNTCGTCHGKIFTKLSNSTAKHRSVACVTCHKGKHRTIPQCSDCHGKPHNPAFHEKFPRCLSCHLDVHDLPNMSGAKKK